MPHGWSSTILTSAADALHVFAELQGKRWLCRGQSEPYGNLLPSIDRRELRDLPRLEKLMLERRSIDLFRSTARFFADQGELIASTDDTAALMVLRHYGSCGTQGRTTDAPSRDPGDLARLALPRFCWSR